MKCSNEIICQGNDNNYCHFKGIFSCFFQGAYFLAELDKPNDFEKSSACDVHFFGASEKTLS